jgi:hypothetical protein
MLSRRSGGRTCPGPLGRLGDRLAVGDLRAADVRVDVELALEAVDDDLEWSSPMPEIRVWPISTSR